MPKRPSHHRVKTHLVYTVAEAAEATGVHRQTVIRWIKAQGLSATCDQRPWLIRGAELKVWLRDRRDRGRTSLGAGEIYCLPCRKPVKPDGDLAEYRARTERTGLLAGICPCCEGMVHRIVREADLDRVAADLDVTVA
ncbi:MAG: helix-turn-helix domain-containing protein [Pseudomonadota bacterium]